MASSSVSQESLDIDDYDTARRNRIRVHSRGHGGHGGSRGSQWGSLPHKSFPDKGDPGSLDREGRSSVGAEDHVGGDQSRDHESPTRGAAARLKDKTRSRTSHMKGGKINRRLREKRRPTGAVHCLVSTESTGDSLDDEEEETTVRKNTSYNEGGAETRHSSMSSYSHPRRNKSPSDLEADLEDNQDYDSTVSHSETNLSLIGRSESSNLSPIGRSESSDMSQPSPNKPLGSAINSSDRFRNLSSKFSPESNRAKFKMNTTGTSNDADQSSRACPSPSSVTPSPLNRYQEVESPNQDHMAPRRFNSNHNNSSTSSTSPQPLQRPLGFSVFNEKNASSSRNSRTDNKPAYLPTGMTGSSSRFAAHDTVASAASGISSPQSSLTSQPRVGYQSSQPSVSSPTSPHSGVNQQQAEAISHLEKQLENSKKDNRRLQQECEDKDKKIAELEKAIQLLNNECDGLDEDNLKLQEENKALIRAMSKLTTNV